MFRVHLLLTEYVVPYSACFFFLVSTTLKSTKYYLYYLYCSFAVVCGHGFIVIPIRRRINMYIYIRYIQFYFIISLLCIIVCCVCYVCSRYRRVWSCFPLATSCHTQQCLPCFFFLLTMTIVLPRFSSFYYIPYIHTGIMYDA